MSIEANYILEIKCKKIDLFEIALIYDISIFKMSYKITVSRWIIRRFLV